MRTDKKYYKVVFIILILILQICSIVALLVDFDGNQANIFFQKTKNYLADYINVAKYSAENNPYFSTINGNGEHAYLPFTYVLFYLLSKLSDYVNLDAFTAGYSTLSLAEINLLFTLLTLIFFIVLKRVYQENNLIDDVLILMLFGSGIYIFSYERGNIVFLSVICLTVYLNYYDSKNEMKKQIAFVALAVAAAIKGFPALFGVLLIYEKRWKDAIYLILYGIIISMLPFVFLENGFSNIPQWLQNLEMNNLSYKYANFPRFGYLAFLSIFSENYNNCIEILDMILKIITVISCLMMAVTSNKQEVKWKKFLGLILILIMFPVNSAIYCGLYLFPVILLFFKEQVYKKYDVIYMFLFVICLNPFQIVIKNVNLTWYLVNISAMIMFGMILIENIQLYKAKICGTNNQIN
jgi:hypothetical protein